MSPRVARALIPLLCAVAATACGAAPTATSSTPATQPPPASSTTAPPPTSTAPPPTTTAPPPRPAGPRPDVLGRIVDRLPTERKLVALTFDAGANDAGVPKILAVLRATHTPATFFLTGRWAQLYPGEARLIAKRYPVGNHTVTHPDLTTLAPAAARAQVTVARHDIISITGHDPRPLFRFPYGAYTPGLIAAVNTLGYAAIGWTVDTLGWEGTSGGQSAATVVSRVVAGLRPGEIVLMHVGSNPTDHSTLDADALTSVIAALRARGYAFTTLVPWIQAS